MRKYSAAALLLLFFVLCINGFAAQSSNSTVGGTVQDATGAFIPGVTITATNTQTGVAATTISNEAGAYQFPSLQPGTYNFSAELPGFSTQTVSGYQLGGSAQARMNFTLQVGNTVTAIDVTTTADAALTTSSNSVGAVLPEYKVRDLPLAVRDVLGLVATTAGVQSSGSFTGNMAGGRLSQVNTTRDGIVVTDGRFENGAFSVTYSSPDLVEEVKIVVAPVDAATSRGSGQVSMVTRSGTNAFRGSAFWTNHNSALDANSWFNNFSSTAKSYDNRNQYGARLGGPIIRNKTFFFALFEGQRDLKKQNTTGPTLTAMARQGIFRYFPGADNANANNANPTVDRSGNPLRPANATGDLAAIDLFGNCTFNGAAVANCRTYRDPLRPAISTHPYMQESLRRMPLPNEFTGGDGLNTAVIRFTRRVEGLDESNGNGTDVNRDQYNLRVDHNFNANHKLSVIGTKEKTWGGANQAGLRAWPDGFDGIAVKRPDIYTISVTSTLSNSLLNEFRVGRRRSINAQFPSGNRSDEVGVEAFKVVPQAACTRDCVNPTVLFQPSPSLWTSFARYGGFGSWRNHVSPLSTLGDDLSWTRGTHAFKGGIEWRHTTSKGYGDPNFTPNATLGAGSNPVNGIDSTVFTGLSANAATTARSLLTDLSGSVASIRQAFGVMSATEPALRGTPAIPYKYFYMHQSEMSTYFKDDWKFSPSLTLNLGVHWEYYGQPYEDTGLAARVIGNDESALTSVTCTVGRPGTPAVTSTCSNLTQVQFVGRNSPNPDILTNLKGNDLNNWAPAVGFSWNLPWFGQDKTVLRAGYGISYQGALRNFITVDNVLGTVPGINLVSGGNGLLYTPSEYTSLSTMTLPIPYPTGTPTTSPFVVQPTDRSLTISTYNRVSPYTQNWNLEIQRELVRNTTFEIRYIGTKSTKLWGTLNLNQIDSLGRNPELFEAFNAVRAGGESELLNRMLDGINLGGTGAQTVNGTTWTGAMAVRTNTTTRGQIANGSVGSFVNTLNTLTTGTGSSNNGAVLRRNGFPENYIVVNPQYASVSMLNNLGNSSYHALQLQFTKRLSGGFTNTTNWTWSKALGDSDGDGGASYRDPRNRAIEKQNLGFDRKHQITSNGTYELPFGPGKPFLANAPGWLNRIVERWQLGGIMNFNSGSYLTIDSNVATISTTSVQPNIVGEFPKDAGKVKYVDNGVVYLDGFTQITDPYLANVSALNGLNTAYANRAIVDPSGKIVLVNPQPGEVGTLGYGTLVGPSSIRLDMNVIKRFRITETNEFEFRVDAINLLNTPNFGNPSLGINGNNTFGRITGATGARSFVVNARVNF